MESLKAAVVVNDFKEMREGKRDARASVASERKRSVIVKMRRNVLWQLN